MNEIQNARDIMTLDLECRNLHRLLSKEQNAREKFLARLAAKDRELAKLRVVIADKNRYYERRMDQAQAMAVVVEEAVKYIEWICHDGTNPIDCPNDPGCAENGGCGPCQLRPVWKAVAQYTKVTKARKESEK